MIEEKLYACKKCCKVTFGKCCICLPTFNTTSAYYKEKIIPPHDPKELLYRIVVLEDRVRKLENYIKEIMPDVLLDVEARINKLEKETFKPIIMNK